MQTRYMLFKTLAGQIFYLSTTGKWIKSKKIALTFEDASEAYAEAKRRDAGIIKR